jgi:uncharacterized membrane protein YgcG
LAQIRFKSGECVEDFSVRITSHVNELRVLGDEITDKEVVKKMLHLVPEKFEQVALSMETLLDLNSLSIEEATSHLHAVEQRKKTTTLSAADVSGRLLLIEEWLAWMKAKEKSGSGGSSSSGGGRGHGRGRGRGCHRGGGQNGGVGNTRSSDRHEDGVGHGACHNCGKMGHWVQECRSKAKKA